MSGLHVVGEPLEVLAEEAGHDGPQDEDRAADRDPRGGRVEAIGVGVEVRLRELEQVLGLALELARDLVAGGRRCRADTGLELFSNPGRARIASWATGKPVACAEASRCSSRTLCLSR